MQKNVLILLLTGAAEYQLGQDTLSKALTTFWSFCRWTAIWSVTLKT